MIFDTGLHRHLTLTQSDEYLRKMRWGTGQPETVRAFLVEADAGQGFSPLVRVEDHWQRRWQFQPKEARSSRALRITVLATWGLDHARIVQVAAWGA